MDKIYFIDKDFYIKILRFRFFTQTSILLSFMGLSFLLFIDGKLISLLIMILILVSIVSFIVDIILLLILKLHYLHYAEIYTEKIILKLSNKTKEVNFDCIEAYLITENSNNLIGGYLLLNDSIKLYLKDHKSIDLIKSKIKSIYTLPENEIYEIRTLTNELKDIANSFYDF